METLHNIKDMAKRVLSSTWGFFKKLLTNPITITAIIMGVFYYFGKKLISWLTEGVHSIRDFFELKIIPIAKFVWSVMKGTYEVIATISKCVYTVVDWLTNPDGWLCKILVFVINSCMALKKGISNLLNKSGKDSIDTLCCFLAGDYITLAFKMIAAGIQKFWYWLKGKKFFRILRGVFKCIVLFGELWATWHIKLIKGIWDFAKAIFSGHGDEALSLLVKPFTDWWKRVTHAFDGVEDAGEIMVENPL